MKTSVHPLNVYPKMFKPLRVGSTIAAKPTFAIESPNRYANEPVIPFATLMAFLGTKPVNDTPINNCGPKINAPNANNEMLTIMTLVAFV